MTTDNKIIYEKKIIQDLIEGKTEFIRNSMNLLTEYINGCRILKMLDNNIKITNLLFREIERTDIEDICDIAMLYRYQDNKKKYLITMRTNKDIDLVELFGNICAGHSKAVSGFITDINKFIRIIK